MSSPGTRARRTHKSVGRPSKGKRHLFSTRVPVDLAEAVQAAADQMGCSYSEYIAWRLAQVHNHDYRPEVTASAPNGQEELPMASAS